jgi:hypothetical protein
VSASIELTQGCFAIVDAADYEWLNQWNWYAALLGVNFYAMTSTSRKAGKRRNILMSRAIIGASTGHEVDHRNHNTLDNRRVNLRICPEGQNKWNQRLHRNNTTGLKGVTFRRDIGKFRAQIKANYCYKFLGFFDTVQEAAETYDCAAIKLHGEFALTNAMLTEGMIVSLTEVRGKSSRISS